MNDRLANDLIGIYEKKLEEHSFIVKDVKYRGRGVTLWMIVHGEEKEYTASFGSGTILDAHVSVLRQAYTELVDPIIKEKRNPYQELQLTENDAAEINEAIEKGTAKPRIEIKPVEEIEKPMKTKLTYKQVYKQ